ncbi:MAG: hypothetical protein AYK18_08100 [Theionarchaea archaeon DG-70]|nr:MAG: hypothetical protein AYK18_08100 [Theionarchaea archaeon DG-70]
MPKVPRIQKYRILEKIEESNYAVIYKVQVKKNKPVVLKIARNKEVEYNDLISHEFQVLSRTRHPNIVSVFDYDVNDDGRAYFTLEYLPYKPINKYFKGFSEEFLAAIAQVLNGLGAFHNNGFIHSDLKPEHIIYDKDEKKAVLIDFGFAQQRLAEQGINHQELELVGTIGYIAPEVLKGIGIDQRSDLYSLGVIIYEILSGEELKDPYVSIEDIPEGIDKMISRLVSREPALRPSIPELYQTLSSYLKKIKLEVPSFKVTLPQTVYVEPVEVSDKLSNTTGTAFIITGDSGVGKTRLLQEMRYRYLMQNYAVLSYTASEKASFCDGLRAFMKSTEIAVSNIEDKFQIYEELYEALLDHAKNRNVVIMVDDLENLSDYELGLFRYLGYGAQNSNILLIATSRSDESYLSGAGWDERISRLGFGILSLKSFSRDDVQTLLEKTFVKIEPTKTRQFTDFAEWLYTQSGGNPLFIVEILKNLYEINVINYQSCTWRIKIDLLKKSPLPSKLEGLLKKRLRILSNAELKILKILSIANCPLEPAIMTSMMTSQAAISIDSLKNRGLLKEESVDKKRMVMISNQILNQLVRQYINKKERRALSKKLITAIETIASDNKSYLSVLARLNEEINDIKKAYNYLQQAALYAESIYDYHSAIAHYEKLLSYEKDINKTNYPETLVKIARDYYIIGKNKVALEYYKKISKLKRKDLLAQVYSGMGHANSAIGDHAQAAAFLKKAISLILRKESVDYIKTVNDLAYSLIYLNQITEAEGILNKSFLLAKKMRNAEMMAETLYYLSSLEWFRNNFDKGIKKALEGVVLSKKHKLLKHYAYAANLLSSLYQQKGDLDQAQMLQEQAINTFSKMKLSDTLASALSNQASLYILQGDLQKARELCKKALMLAQQTDSRTTQYISLANLSLISDDLGEFEKAIDYSKKTCAIEPNNIFANYNLSMLYYKNGKVYKAKSILKNAITKKNSLLYHVGLALINLSIGKSEEAEEMLLKRLDTNEINRLDTIAKIQLYSGLFQFYYEKTDFEQSLTYAEKVIEFAPPLSKEHIVAHAFIKINNFKLREISKLDITEEACKLKNMGCIYDYAHLKRLALETVIDTGIEQTQIKAAVDELNEVTEIFETLGAELDFRKTRKIQGKLFPIIASEFSKRSISAQYLEAFSNLAELISSNLGDIDFIQNTLDLVIHSTGAERGAIFINNPKGMEFVAGRSMDRTTIRDAGELSKTAIRELEKNRIVFARDALSDPEFSVKKSVMLNQIHSLLCIPLIVSGNIIGAIYLDSRLTAGIFDLQDKDFLLTVSKILASVIEKSLAFRTVTEENILLKSNIIKDIGSGYLTGKSRAMKRIYKVIDSVAETNSPVLILGETGTGKGMIARLIHMKSKRHDKKFLTINCGTIPETLLESELFGHKKGAFTGAISDKKGLLEEAQSGTVFLDEVTNTSPSFQAKILEAIEEKIIRRIGETITRNIDVRFLFATNRDLEIEVEMGRFRKDLFYRINVFIVEVPPLRERISDISLLTQFFLDKYSKEMNKKIDGFTAEAMQKLKEYFWPGNVRELQNVTERAVVLTRDDVITANDLGLGQIRKSEFISLTEIKKDAIVEALNMTGWNIKQAAEALHINRRTIERYIKKYNITKQL